MGLFQEYMDSKGKVRQAKVDASGGDPDPKTPPNKPKNGKPYIASDGKSRKTKSEKGLGDEGDKDLKYEPSTDPSSKGKEPAKIPTVEQFEIAALVSEAVERDPTVVEQVVRQIKQKGLLGPLVAEMLQHGATYNHLSEVMASERYGFDTCKKLVRAMSEEVAPAFASQMHDNPEDEDDPDAIGDPGAEDDLFADDDDMEPGMDMGMGDPNMADPSMEDPNMMGDPMGQDMMGQNPQGGPQDAAMGATTATIPNVPPMGQPTSPLSQPSKAMKNFQRAMMRSM